MGERERALSFKEIIYYETVRPQEFKQIKIEKRKAKKKKKQNKIEKNLSLNQYE